jgi:hypothetical protein
MAVGPVIVIDTASAFAKDYPYCIKGRDWLSPVGDCSFSSYQQCQATAPGRLAYCDVNPFYSQNRMPERQHHR